MVETPVIAPSQFLRLEGVRSEDNRCTVAIVAFCPFRAMKGKANARPLDRSLFSHLHPAHQFQGLVGGAEVLMVERVYGGPVCATVVEEMAYLGVKHVIGYGYSGSLRQGIAPGSIVLASSGIVSDGTSREYSKGDVVEASASLMSTYERLDASVRTRVYSGRAWTTDAIYREYPSKIQFWIERGADFVNMDTSHFYAVSRAVGIEALYFSVISDYVGGKEWKEDFLNIEDSIESLQDMVLKLVTLIE